MVGSKKISDQSISFEEEFDDDDLVVDFLFELLLDDLLEEVDDDLLLVVDMNFQ